MRNGLKLSLEVLGCLTEDELHMIKELSIHLPFYIISVILSMIFKLLIVLIFIILKPCVDDILKDTRMTDKTTHHVN